MNNLKKNLVLKAFIILTAFCIIIYSLFQIYSLVNKSAKTGNEKKLYFDELGIASTPEKRQQGLMNVKSLCNNCGMLFVFEREQFLSFWMKNTFVSLDIIYLNNDFEVLNIHKKTITNQTYKTYSSNGVAKYVLEVNAGYSDQNDIEEKDKLFLFNSNREAIEF